MHRFLLLVTPSSLHFSHLEMQLHRADRQRGGSMLRRINGMGYSAILQLHFVSYLTYGNQNHLSTLHIKEKL